MSDDTNKLSREDIERWMIEQRLALQPHILDRPVYGPRTPRIDTDGATFEIQNGRIMCIGAGWEADSGPLTRDEAQAIIDMLMWALECDLLSD